MTLPPDSALRRPKSLAQKAWDLLGAPLRMILLPDERSEALHLTSLRAERLAVVLPRLTGRVLDIGAGDNTLIRIYTSLGRSPSKLANESVGCDVVDWGGNCLILPNCEALPFPPESFDTVCFIACINHIPERVAALREAIRVLKPGGKVVLTMIGSTIGEIGHKIWWYSEDKHREVHHDEKMGLNDSEMIALIEGAGFVSLGITRFVYGLNNLYIASKAA